MPATDALTMRTALTEQVNVNSRFRALVDYYCGLESKTKRMSPEVSVAKWGAGKLATALQMAETFYVAPDMHALALRASEDFPGDEAIIKEDQPSEAGFMYLPQRFRMFELRGRLVVVHACLWINNRIWMLTDRLDPEDEISAEIRQGLGGGNGGDVAQVGRWDVCGLVEFGYGKPMPTSISFDKSVLPPSAKVEWSRTKEGRVAMYTDHYIDNTKVPEPRPDPFLRFMLAIWRLMQQTLAELHTEENHPRPDRRRADRQHVPHKVTVIQLRRREGHYEGSGESINYRTLVRGHWRRVWCGPLDGERYRRAVYIHPFIRGPKDAPLIIRERINALVR